jgi:hypothetical protein
MKKLLYLTCLLWCWSNTQAQTITLIRGGVPGASYTTLKAAIAASSSGDVLQFSAHTFKGFGDTIRGKSLHLKGSISGKDITTLDAESKGSHLVALSPHGSSIKDSLIVEDIIFRNGQAVEPAKITTSRSYNGGSILSTHVGLASDPGGAWDPMHALYIKGNCVFHNNSGLIIPNPFSPEFYFGGAIAWGGYIEIGDRDRSGSKVRFINNKYGVVASTSLLIQGHVDFDENEEISIFTKYLIIDGNAGQINFRKNKSNNGTVINVGLTGSPLRSRISGNVYIAYNESKAPPSSGHKYGTIGVSDSLEITGSGIIIEHNKTHAEAVINTYSPYLSLNNITIRHNTSLGQSAVINAHGAGNKIEIRNCDIHHNIAKQPGGATIYDATPVEESESILIEDTRMYNPRTDDLPRVEIKNTPNLNTSRTWWGCSDTTGLIIMHDATRLKPIINNYAVANWSVNKGLPVTTTTFPIDAQLTKNDGSALYIKSFPSLVGEYFATSGTFSSNPAPIDTRNLINSSYTKGSTKVPVMVVVDADTFITDSEGLSIANTQLKLEGLSLYPNPSTTGTVHIAGLDAEEYQYTIIGIDGKVLHAFLPLPSNRTILLHHLPQGQYIIAITGAKGSAMLKCTVARD